VKFMKFEEHAITHAFGLLVIIIIALISDWINFQWWLIIAFILAFFMVNPDIWDRLFGVKYHRAFWSHSALLPVMIYWGWHPLWNMDQARLVGVVLFFPVLVHLLSDYRIEHLVDDHKRGSYLISFFGKRINKTWSFVYITANVAGIIAYMIWVL